MAKSAVSLWLLLFVWSAATCGVLPAAQEPDPILNHSSGETLSGGNNMPPTFLDIPNVTIAVNSDFQLPLNVADAETRTEDLIVRGASSDTNLVSNLLVYYSYGCEQTNWFIRLRPAAFTGGTAIISVSATDLEGLTATKTFTLTVAHCNGAPTISEIPNQVAAVGIPTAAIPFSIGYCGAPPETLRLNGLSSDTNLVLNENLIFGGVAEHRFLIITPEPIQAGSTIITVTMSTDEGLTASRTFILSVLQQGGPPIISQPGNKRILPGGTTVFSVHVNGPSPRAYQWLFNGASLIGATNAALILTNVQPNSAGSYSLMVSTFLGAITSQAAQLWVQGPVRLGNLQRLFNGASQMTIFGDPGDTYEIYATCDFFTWKHLGTVVSENGLVEFSDPDSSRFSRRFYWVQVKLDPW